jgi:hypothetical protein
MSSVVVLNLELIQLNSKSVLVTGAFPRIIAAWQGKYCLPKFHGRMDTNRDRRG